MGFIAQAKEVPLGDRGRSQQPFECAKSRPKANGSRWGFFHLNIQADLVITGPLTGGEFGLLEVSGGLELLSTSFYGCCVVQITFAYSELPPDDLIPGLCVSGNVD